MSSRSAFPKIFWKIVAKYFGNFCQKSCTRTAGPVVIKKRQKGIFKKIIVLCCVLSLVIAYGVAWIHDSRFEATLKKADNIVILEQDYSIVDLYTDKDLMVVVQSGKRGVLKYDWTEVVPCEYADIRIQEDVNRILALTSVTSDNGGTGEIVVDVSSETENYVLFDMDGNKLNIINGLVPCKV